MGLAVAYGVYFGIAGILDSSEPVHWGTFTEERCVDGGRYGCRSVGTWVSDDGSIRLEDVYLDGRPNADGTIDASYQPTGIRNDADANIVHSPVGASLEPFVSLMLVAIGIGFSVLQWRRWRGTWE